MDSEQVSSGLDLSTLVFVKFREEKHKEEAYINYFLSTADGVEVLAATGEDHGSAHYQYKTNDQFSRYGGLSSHNRKELIMWLEMVIKESQLQIDGTAQEAAAHLGEPTPDNPLGLYFTGQRCDKGHAVDGHRRVCYYLIDQHGGQHLAVVGEERDTRDGHYVYSATEEFATRYPLNCQNQREVLHWLEQRITHRLPSSGQQCSNSQDYSHEASPGAGSRGHGLASGGGGSGGGAPMGSQHNSHPLHSHMQQGSDAVMQGAPQFGAQMPLPEHFVGDDDVSSSFQAAGMPPAPLGDAPPWLGPVGLPGDMFNPALTAPGDMPSFLSGAAALDGSCVDASAFQPPGLSLMPALLPDELPAGAFDMAVMMVNSGAGASMGYLGEAEAAVVGGSMSELAASPFDGLQPSSLPSFGPLAGGATAVNGPGLQGALHDARKAGPSGDAPSVPPQSAPAADLMPAQGATAAAALSTEQGQPQPTSSAGAAGIAADATPRPQPGESRPPKTLSVGHSTRQKDSAALLGKGVRQPGTKHKLAGVAEAAHLRKLQRLAAAGEEAVKAVQGAYLTTLRQAASQEAAQQEAMRKHIASWVRGQVSEDEATVLTWHDGLVTMLRDANHDQLTSSLFLSNEQLRQLAVQAAMRRSAAPPCMPGSGAVTASAGGGPAAAAASRAAPSVSNQPSKSQPTAVNGPTPAAMDVDEAGASDEPSDATRGAAMAATAALGSAGQVGMATAGEPPPAPSAGADAAAALQQQQVVDIRSSASVAIAAAGTAYSWAWSDPHWARNGVRTMLESLRELAALCPPLTSMANSNLVDTVVQCSKHPHPAVSGLAKEILARWRGTLVHKIKAMADPKQFQDPVAALESKIQANQVVFPPELLAAARSAATSAAAAAAATQGMPGSSVPPTPAAGLPPRESMAMPGASTAPPAAVGGSNPSVMASPMPGASAHGDAGQPGVLGPGLPPAGSQTPIQAQEAAQDAAPATAHSPSLAVFDRAGHGRQLAAPQETPQLFGRGHTGANPAPRHWSSHLGGPNGQHANGSAHAKGASAPGPDLGSAAALQQLDSTLTAPDPASAPSLDGDDAIQQLAAVFLESAGPSNPVDAELMPGNGASLPGPADDGAGEPMDVDLVLAGSSGVPLLGTDSAAAQGAEGAEGGEGDGEEEDGEQSPTAAHLSRLASKRVPPHSTVVVDDDDPLQGGETASEAAPIEAAEADQPAARASPNPMTLF